MYGLWYITFCLSKLLPLFIYIFNSCSWIGALNSVYCVCEIVGILYSCSSQDGELLHRESLLRALVFFLYYQYVEVSFQLKKNLIISAFPNFVGIIIIFHSHKIVFFPRSAHVHGMFKKTSDQISIDRLNYELSFLLLAIACFSISNNIQRRSLLLYKGSFAYTGLQYFLNTCNIK